MINPTETEFSKSMNTPRIEVRGHGSFSKLASRNRKAGALLFDLFIIIGIVLSLVYQFGLFPTLSSASFSLFIGVGAIYWIIPRWVFGVTLGERIFDLAPQPS